MAPLPGPGRVRPLGRQIAELCVAGDRFRRHVHPPPPAVLAGLGPLGDDARFVLHSLRQGDPAPHPRAAAEAGLEMPNADVLIA